MSIVSGVESAGLTFRKTTLPDEDGAFSGDVLGQRDER